MNYEEAIEREDAMEWLLENCSDWPINEIAGSMSRHVSNPMVQRWRWILTLNREVVFSNMYQPCISKEDFEQRKAVSLSGQVTP